MKYLDEVDPTAEKSVQSIQLSTGRGFCGVIIRTVRVRLKLCSKRPLSKADMWQLWVPAVVPGPSGSASSRKGAGLPSSTAAAQAVKNLQMIWSAISNCSRMSKKLPYDIVINATPVGMTPHDEYTPVKPELLAAGTVVMDMVYNPLKTRLLKEAGKADCHTIEGISMLVHQGAVQFELWTGQKAPVDIMRSAVLDELSSR